MSFCAKADTSTKAQINHAYTKSKVLVEPLPQAEYPDIASTKIGSNFLADVIADLVFNCIF